MLYPAHPEAAPAVRAPGAIAQAVPISLITILEIIWNTLNLVEPV